MNKTAREHLIEVIKPRLADPAEIDDVLLGIEHLIAAVIEDFTRRPIPTPTEFREICRDLLGWHGSAGGTAPGSFRNALFNAIYAADRVNRAKLLDFTGEVLAVTISESLGDDSLREIAQAPDDQIEEIAFNMIRGLDND